MMEYKYSTYPYTVDEQFKHRALTSWISTFKLLLKHESKSYKITTIEDVPICIRHFVADPNITFLQYCKAEPFLEIGTRRIRRTLQDQWKSWNKIHFWKQKVDFDGARKERIAELARIKKEQMKFRYQYDT